MLIPSSAFNVRKLASVDAMRYAMNGVLVERQADGKPRMVATDGRRLGIVTWEEEDAAEYPLVEGVNPLHAANAPFRAILEKEPIAPFATAPKIAKVRRILANVALDEHSANGVVQLASTDCSTVKRASVRSIDGEFPTFDGVMPKGTPRATALLSVELLRGLLEAAEKSTGKSAVRLSIYEEVCDGPIKVESVSIEGDTTNGVAFTGAIMPINDPERETEIKARKEAAQAKAASRDQRKAEKAVA